MLSRNRIRLLQTFLWDDDYEPPEEPDQRDDGSYAAAAVRRDKIHVLFLGMSLLLLLAGFLFFWLAHTILPLFFSLLLVFLLFHCFESRPSRRKRSPSV